MSVSQSTTHVSQKINCQEVSESQRSAMLPKYFPCQYIWVESIIYAWMARLCVAYNGGYWNMYELSNGAIYMAPASDSQFMVTCPGWGEDVSLSADAAGLVACLYAVNQLANQGGKDRYIDLYYRLRDFASEHPEAEYIFKAID